MRIVSWNCNGKFSKRIEYLNELNADIYCIQECESPDRVAYDFDGAIFWEGFLSYKGLGTFVRKGIEAARLDWEPYGTCYFLPLRIADRLNLVNVWTQPGYVSEWYIYQQLHKDKFDAKTLLCGDFNSFEGNKKRRQVFARMRIA